jgi:hypothetical protein
MFMGAYFFEQTEYVVDSLDEMNERVVHNSRVETGFLIVDVRTLCGVNFLPRGV